MARGTLSLLGIYKYTNDVLDDLALPDDLETERQTIVDNLLMETAELEILYPDSWFLKQAIGAWSRKQVRVWQELYDTTQYEYNPIWNKDGTYIEKETTARDLTGKDNQDGVVTNEATGESTAGTTAGGTAAHDVYGFNSSTAAPESLDTTSDTSNTTANTLTKVFGTTKNNAERSEDENVSRELQRTEQGNIGLITTQQMIKEQRDVVLFNIIDYIINDFKERFCILVY